MAHRIFTDSQGVEWLVWSTTPSSGAVLDEEMRQGWLTFEAPGERRRLIPIPKGWEDAAPDRLELYCRAAKQTARRTPAHGIRRPPPPSSGR